MSIPKKTSRFIPQIELLDMKEIMEYLSIGERTFYRIKKRPDFPEPLLTKDRKNYWDKEDVDDFLAQTN